LPYLFVVPHLRCFNWQGAAISDFKRLGTGMSEMDVGADLSSAETASEQAAATARAEAMLHRAGLRHTRQRLALAELIFGRGDRHFSAEMLYTEAMRANQKVSLATVYNTLNHLAKHGLLRTIGVDGATTFFDTRIGDHHHFFIEGLNEVRDIPTNQIRIGTVSSVPEGYEISRVHLMIRLRPKC
jgi:Fur family iron response transcriptional regulator